jgi:hypothetical protein
MSAAADIDMDELRERLIDRVEGVAEAVLGPHNRRVSRRGEWRWHNRGSLVLVLSGPDRGAFFDNEAHRRLDAIQLIREHTAHSSFEAARDWAAAFVGMSADTRPESPETAAERQRKRDQQRADAEALREIDERRRISEAQALWAASTAAVGTLADQYLRETRCIQPPAEGWPDAVRFHAGSSALIVAATLPDGTVRAVQRVLSALAPSRGVPAILFQTPASIWNRTAD